MREFETVEIHALGNAISTAVLTCENLVRNKYGVLTKVRTDTVELPDKYDNRNRSYQTFKKPKIMIAIKRTENFFETMDRFEQIREDAIKKESESKKLQYNEEEEKGHEDYHSKDNSKIFKSQSVIKMRA